MSECPGIPVWRTFLAGVMAPADRSAAEGHLARCRFCRDRLVALNDEASEAAVQESAPSALTSRVTRQAPAGMKSRPVINVLRRYAPLALAATIAIAAGLSVFVYWNKQSFPDTPRISNIRQSNGASRELALVNPANGAELSVGKLGFRWSEAGEGARYEFSLTDEKGDIIHQEKVTTNSLVLDSSALRLSTQKKYYWSIVARLADGTSRESGIAGFTLR
jgi:hypothetical protein